MKFLGYDLCLSNINTLGGSKDSKHVLLAMLTVKRSCSVFHILVVDALELIYPFLFQINSEFQKQSSASHEFMLNSCTSDLSRTYLIGKSPFPTLDVFVESIATIGNVSGGAFFRKLHL